MSEFQPLELEVSGKPRIFTLEDTEVRLYRYVVDTVFNHVRTVEHGSQVVHLFNVPNLLCILTGQEVPDHTFDKKTLKKATTTMDERLGWNAKMVVEDACPQEIKDRYIKIATAPLRQEVVVVPNEWH